jgi:hypothetical protein
VTGVNETLEFNCWQLRGKKRKYHMRGVKDKKLPNRFHNRLTAPPDGTLKSFGNSEMGEVAMSI